MHFLTAIVQVLAFLALPSFAMAAPSGFADPNDILLSKRADDYEVLVDSSDSGPSKEKRVSACNINGVFEKATEVNNLKYIENETTFKCWFVKENASGKQFMNKICLNGGDKGYLKCRNSEHSKFTLQSSIALQMVPRNSDPYTRVNVDSTCKLLNLKESKDVSFVAEIPNAQDMYSHIRFSGKTGYNREPDFSIVMKIQYDTCI